MKDLSNLIYALVTYTIFLKATVRGHSWVENVKVIERSLFKSIAPVGYIRNYVGRQSTSVDIDTTNRILSITSDIPACKDNQQFPGQFPGLPKLSAYANDLISAEYLENGHIWKELEHIDPTSSNSGRIYWYGTQLSIPNRTIDSILEWNSNSTGGDRQGRLLATSSFDDGTCIEVGQEAKTGRPGGPCKSYFRLPTDAIAEKDYTVYWLWDYSLHFGTTIPDHVEWYSSCMDINILQGLAPARPFSSSFPSVLGGPNRNSTFNVGSTSPDGIIQEAPRMEVSSRSLNKKCAARLST